MSGSRRAGVAVAAAAIVFATIGTVAWRRASDPSDDVDRTAAGGSAAVVADVTSARAPFETATAGTIRVGERRLVVVVADSATERSTGLRGRTDAAPYDGMLFVFDTDTRAAFTMAGVPAPLDIGFYAADGTRVDALRMEPCAGTDATCPIYQPSAPFRYSLETAAGALPAGSLRVR